MDRSVELSKIALEIPGTVQLLSIVRRLSRFLDNQAFHVRKWYNQIARNLILEMSRTVGENPDYR